MSFRFVAVRIHAVGRNLQGSQIVHALMKIACCTSCSCETKKAA